MANRYWVGGTANWDATAGTKWATTSGGAGGSAVPTTADDVFLDSASGTVTVTISAAASCRSLDCTGFTGTLSQGTQTLNIGDGTAGASNIALKMVPGMTYSVGAGVTTLQSTSATQQTITTGGKAMGNMTINGVGGSYIFADDYLNVYASNRTLTLSGGTLDAGGYNVTVGKVQLSSATNTRVLTMGSGIWTLGATSGSPWISSVTTNLTLNPDTSTIVISDTGASTKTFSSGGLTFNNISITGGGAGAIIFNNAAVTTTINSLTINAPKTVTFTQTATYAFNNFVATGSIGNIITLNSGVGGSAYILSKPSGTVSCDYLSIQDSSATGGASWYAGANSTSVSGNSGWIFTAPPSSTGNFFQLFA